MPWSGSRSSPVARSRLGLEGAGLQLLAYSHERKNGGYWRIYAVAPRPAAASTQRVRPPRGAGLPRSECSFESQGASSPSCRRGVLTTMIADTSYWLDCGWRTMRITSRRSRR